MAPRILLATTCRWFSTARQAVALHNPGGQVEVVCPSNHPVRSSKVTEKIYPYRGLTPLHDFRAAMLASRPDLIIPCDELAVRHLHRLYQRALESSDADSCFIRSLLEYSLGDPESFSITESRDHFMSMAARLEIRAPETKTVLSTMDVKAWLTKFGFPAVLKAEGTSGGEGVKIVHTLEQALRAYRTLRNPVSAMVAAKRAVLDKDWNDVVPWLMRRKRTVSIQAFVNGPDANIAAACWQGEILSAVTVEVLETWRPKGPATVVRLLENAEMAQAAERIVRRLKFSGLCGFDFMLEKATGAAYIIEMNARATQTCSLALGPREDPMASICSAIGGKPVLARATERPGDTIALFPGAWHGNVKSPVFQTAYHDIPWESPELVRHGLAQSPGLSRERWIRLFTKMGLHQS